MTINLKNLPFLNKVSLRDRAFLARQLSIMLSAGITLDKALRVLQEKSKNPVIIQALNEIINDIETGHKFSVALARQNHIFDSIFINTVRAGESAGKLSEVLVEISDWLEQEYEFYSRLKNAIIYPVFIVGVMACVVIVMLVKVIPQLQEIFASYQTQLPWTTRSLIFLANFASNYWWVLIGLAVILVWMILYWVKLPSGMRFIDRLKIKDPSGLGLEIYMARFSRTMSILMKSGVPIIQAIEITADSLNNVWYQQSLKNAIKDVERGIPFSVPIEKNPFFPSIVSEMLTVGEQTGRLDEILESLANYYDAEVDNKLKGLVALIEPLLIVLIGIVVAFVVSSVLVPIYDLVKVM